MRTDPRSRHGRSGRKRWLQILEEREEADRARAQVDAGLPADFHIHGHALQFGASFHDENDEDADESCLCEAGFEGNSDSGDTYDSDTAALVPGGCE